MAMVMLLLVLIVNHGVDGKHDGKDDDYCSHNAADGNCAEIPPAQRSRNELEGSHNGEDIGVMLVPM